MRGFCSQDLVGHQLTVTKELFLCLNTGISHQSSAVLSVTLATTLSSFLYERPLHCTLLH
jgi:hypothetical protein